MFPALSYLVVLTADPPEGDGVITLLIFDSISDSSDTILFVSSFILAVLADIAVI